MEWIKFEDKLPTTTLQPVKILCHCPKWVVPIVAYYTHFEAEQFEEKNVGLKERLSIVGCHENELGRWTFFRLPTHYAIIDKPALPPNATIEQKIGELTNKH